MIHRTHRFHGHGSLRFVYQHGETLRAQYGTLKYIANPKRKSYRMAVVVSRKVHKSAVVRNRIRRRLYEIVRKLEPEMTGAYDMIFSVYSDQVATMDSTELTQRVVDKLEKAAIIPVKTTD